MELLLNDWYDKNSGEYIYCVGDNKMNIIGFFKNTEISRWKDVSTQYDYYNIW